jgi:hypothetical protein
VPLSRLLLTLLTRMLSTAALLLPATLSLPAALLLPATLAGLLLLLARTRLVLLVRVLVGIGHAHYSLGVVGTPTLGQPEEPH